ncbi:MAG: biopolymer transporter ExbB [Alphaproteobacteria bacterium]|nr:biopolymer transporter ExbB [Alphaproteobacteria bacterium]
MAKSKADPQLSSESTDTSGGSKLPVDIPSSDKILDLTTIIGLFVAVGLIFAAAYLGQTGADFFQLSAVLIVVCGTLAVTAISYSAGELKHIYSALDRVFVRKIPKDKQMAEQLVNLAARVRKHGPLSLTKIEGELRKEPMLAKAMAMVADGMEPGSIEVILKTESETFQESAFFAASALRKAGEVAPAMGLIGTLVGLVQMLAQLEDPSSIGPAMALALLTTFYGAILGTVLLTPLSVKMERAAEQELLTMTMIRLSALSMSKQENPRHLETVLNSLLPAKDHINYFR